MLAITLMGRGIADSATVTNEGVKIIQRTNQAQYIRITNLGESYVYLTPSNSLENEAEIGKGIALAPKGEYGSFIEFDRNKFFRSDIWAIADVDTDVAILIGH